jgi:hypothetical protein
VKLETDLPSPDAVVVPIKHRIWTAIGIGMISGLCTWLYSLRSGSVADFYYPLTAARHFLDGLNPYLIMGTGASAIANDTALFYPFTAVMAAIPLARLPFGIASAIFLGLSTALLAFFITRDGLWRIHVFASSPFVLAVVLAQFSPLLMVMAFVPGLGMVAALKPNIGLALFARQPTKRAVVSVLALVGVSLVIFPTWPMHWLHVVNADITETGVHVMPVREFGGLLLLASALHWRRASGRLLLAMCLVPQGLFFYDALPLWLIPRTRQQSIFLTACSQAAVFSWYFFLREGQSVVRAAAPSIMWLIYMPALAVVLWQWWQERAGAAAQKPI